jgi:hypothetical protein
MHMVFPISDLLIRVWVVTDFELEVVCPHFPGKSVGAMQMNSEVVGGSVDDVDVEAFDATAPRTCLRSF